MFFLASQIISGHSQIQKEHFYKKMFFSTRKLSNSALAVAYES